MTPEQMIETSIRYRGSVLHDVAWLEKLIDNFIIYHFTTDELKIIEMQLLLFGDNRLNLENKRQIFDYIAIKHHADWYNSYAPIRIKDYKKSVPMNNDIIWIIEERNKFAHLVLDTTDLGIKFEGEIGFLRYKNATERYSYNEKAFRELMFTIKNVADYLVEKLGNK
ncbi:hypothetical protein [Mucilaginibacter sp. KACC 22063]|uniref:hypothetical protein n=1 Tax=Mucilaginibacter sp. KACC 22063 TaxID=3025666 RepID=UPI0023659129|nr:hypothetical protein [Mucilaginibacter sp. KACC 22063]WDF55205.1 hypothetical protein PQ461_19930 [Mucilaginibacter sp. KACC 22063]